MTASGVVLTLGRGKIRRLRKLMHAGVITRHDVRMGICTMLAQTGLPWLPTRVGRP